MRTTQGKTCNLPRSDVHGMPACGHWIFFSILGILHPPSQLTGLMRSEAKFLPRKKACLGTYVIVDGVHG